MKGFTKVPNFLILYSDDLDAYEFRIFLVLLSLKPCYPSYQNIQDWTGISRNKVRTALNGLRDKGRISWQRGNSFGKNNRYRILSLSKTGSVFDYRREILQHLSDSEAVHDLYDQALVEHDLCSIEGNQQD